jgi:hypothetical protein
MALSVVQLKGYISGAPGGSVGINPTDMQNATPPQFMLQDTLANGDNTILVPATADGCIIIFDPTSATVKKLKGVAGDTGVILAKNKWNVITFDTTPITDFIINSAGVDTGKTTTFIFF